MMEEITNCTRLQTYILTCISWEFIHFLNQPQVATGRTAVFSFFYVAFFLTSEVAVWVKLTKLMRVNQFHAVVWLYICNMFDS